MGTTMLLMGLRGSKWTSIIGLPLIRSIEYLPVIPHEVYCNMISMYYPP